VVEFLKADSSYPELRQFLDDIYEKAKLPIAKRDKREIVDRCVDAFVFHGYEDRQSVAESSEYIKDDVLKLKDTNVPHKLVVLIYLTILEFTKKVL
jgi:hypothetical protein